MTNDRDLMENMLLLEKGVCDLFMHGAIESSTAQVRNTFEDSLHTALSLQDQIYTKMEERGWYSADQADSSKINSVKMKFSGECC